jgi:hypothetical protein
MNDRNFRETR